MDGDTYRDDRGRGNDAAIEDVTYPLHAVKGQSEQQVVAYQCHGTNVGPMGTFRSGNGNETGGVPFLIEGDSAASTPALPRLRAGCGRGGETGVLVGMAVRRIMPIECEKLMGFPPGWTQFGEHGEEIADGPRYRMLGNSVAVPVVEWICKRICELETSE